MPPVRSRMTSQRVLAPSRGAKTRTRPVRSIWRLASSVRAKPQRPPSRTDLARDHVRRVVQAHRPRPIRTVTASAFFRRSAAAREAVWPVRPQTLGHGDHHPRLRQGQRGLGQQGRLFNCRLLHTPSGAVADINEELNGAPAADPARSDLSFLRAGHQRPQLEARPTTSGAARHRAS
jgi:hypothetical protein